MRRLPAKPSVIVERLREPEPMELPRKLSSNGAEAACGPGSVYKRLSARTNLSGSSHAISNEPNSRLCPAPFVMAPLMVNVVNQLLSYYIAKYLGTDIDKPRNLAKSVTVE